MKKISIIKGDITLQKTDIIVNAANTALLGGGGVDGAIHSAAGPDLLKECSALNGCASGEAKITKGYKLAASYVIHTPGPVYRNGKNNESETLKNCYINSMKLALQYKAESISFPAISTGIYNYPKKEAAVIALSSITEFMDKNNYYPQVVIVLYDEENYMIYKNLINETGE
ncbi:MAG: O-acetyl-ADP-ribose deacetylase [Spirochaetes bacterium]|nr:O-acetyl-ADP-ribose deacetylase [Spirochaetota bacterium]